MHILIVDDHPLFRAGLHAMLAESSLGASITSVATLSQALDALRQHDEISLVLLDLNLRDAQGFAGLDAIGEQFPTIACVIISDDVVGGLTNQAIANGAFGLIPKSYRLDRMLDAINIILAGNVYVPSPPGSAEKEVFSSLV